MLTQDENQHQNIYWMVDVLKIVSSEGSSLNWQRIVDLARDHAVLFHLKLALRCIQANDESSIPSVVHELIGRAKPKSIEHFDSYFCKEGSRNLLYELSFLISYYVRHRGIGGNRYRNFFSFLKFWWGIESWYMLPAKLIGRLRSGRTLL